ncbi:hypothetical protein PBI_SCTP2_36 [Salicola phage SCTP-2]|nr:hypothetical protein PBI_SCTP2_36 [Salicola phage SCTP-2]
MKITELFESQYGTNEGEFNNSEYSYIPEKKAIYTVIRKTKNLYLIIIVYYEGYCVLTSSKSPNVEDMIIGSMNTLKQENNVRQAMNHFEECFELAVDIIRRYRYRMKTMRFSVFERSTFEILQRKLERPDSAAQLTRLGYEHTDIVEDGSTFYVEYEIQ